MLSFSSLILAVSAIAGVLAAPSKALEKRLTTSSRGTNNGFYYSFWTDGTSDVTYANGASGQYSVVWKGTKATLWRARVGCQEAHGTLSPVGNGYISVYGWTTELLIEYYIVESYGTYNPSSAATLKGTVTTDGGTYDILETTRTNQPSISGTATFQQYWSVRTSKRTSGTVTTANHFAAWARLGMELGNTYNYQIVATEGYQSAGISTITVS